MEEAKRRFVGIELGKRLYEVAIVGKRGGVKLSHGKTTVEGRQALYRKLEVGDKVALEAGNLHHGEGDRGGGRCGCSTHRIWH